MTTKSRLRLAHKFYLTLVLPLVVVSALVTWVTYRGLESNAAELADALRLQAKTNRLLPLLLTQDDASKALLIDPSQLEVFSSKKIGAYDEHKEILAELTTSATNPEVRRLLDELATLDETKLRPSDTKILEMLFDDPEKARALYFTEYEPFRVEYERSIRELARLGSAGAEAASAELASKNNHSLLQIGLALLLGIGVVATAITILSRQVERSEENTKSLLAVLSEGLFFFDRHGAVASERSQALTRIIPGSADVTTLQQFVTKHSSVTEANVNSCLKLLWNVDGDDFVSDFESTISFLPKTLVLEGTRLINLEYRPLYDSRNALERVVVVCADVTEQVKRDKEAVLQAERVRKISRVAAGLDSYLSFFEEAVGLFRRADGIVNSGARSPDQIVQLQRDLHTLKGSIGTFDFTSLAEEIHHLESLIAEEGPTSAKILPSWERIKDQWKFETSDIETVLGLKDSQGKVTLAKAKFERLKTHVLAHGDEVMTGLIEDTLRSPLKEVFAKYESYLEKLTERHADKQVRLTYETDSCELAYTEVQRLDPAFVHIVRNCFDHGIEDQEQRKQARKPAVGTIRMACYRKADGWLHFIIKDDGQGVDGDKLAEKAVKGGHWTAAKAQRASYQEKIELVFVANLSTKDSVTETSGRGVGMDAVRALLRELGGRITIYSKPGQGTQFEFDVPPLTKVEGASGGARRRLAAAG